MTAVGRVHHADAPFALARPGSMVVVAGPVRVIPTG
jgi:hypothetical protein